VPLQFFTNSGNSYGSAVPFQRIVEPAQLGFFLNLEQAELLRIQRYNEGWRFYFGKHWLFKREDGEPLVTFNYFRKIIDKAVEFMVAKGFVNRVPDSLELITKPFLDEVWEYNKRDQIVWDFGTTGAVTGDVFAMITYEEPSEMQRRVNPFSQGRIRVNLLGSEQVYPSWDPLNTDVLIAVRIETIYYAERGTRELDRDDRVNHEGRQLHTKRFTQIITRDQIVEQFHGEMPKVRPNILGEIPLVHIKNLSLPKEYYGLPDGTDLIDVQRELNEKSTDISDTINYHSAPVTAIFGAKAKQLQRGARQIWSGLPKDARVETLKLDGDLVAAKAYVDFVKKVLHELSDTPEGALGAMQPISNTSGVALHMMYQPLIGKTKRKKAQFEPGFEQINYFIMRIGMVKGLLNLPFDVCKHCGGRIIETEVMDAKTGQQKLTRIWNPETQSFDKIPLRKKRCFHIDKQTMEYTDPYEMRVKYWRQYGFGAELRDMPMRQVVEEITAQQRSFWDYTVVQDEQAEKWRAENVAAIQAAHTTGTENMTPEEPKAVPEGMEAPEPQPHMPATPNALIPQVAVEPPKIEMPPMLRIMPMPIGEIDVPEEPVQITVMRQWTHPDTGAVIDQEAEEMFLVPMDCQRPAYLNPFENKVEFLDVLPKDEALQAQLYQQYLQMEIVDAEWVQDHITEIAKDSQEIRRRMKKRTAMEQRLEPQTIQKQEGGTLTAYQGELAPAGEKLGQVPGPGGNPQDQSNQLGGGQR
jgi:hypothetical protein